MSARCVTGPGRLVVLTSCLILAGGGFVRAGETAQELLQKAKDRYAAAKSYECTVKVVIAYPGETYEGSGKFMVVAPDKLRIENKSTVKNESGSLKSESLTVSDGSELWVSSKTDKGEVVTRLDLTRVKAAVTDTTFASLYLPIQGILGQLDLSVKLYDFARAREDATGQAGCLLTGTLKKDIPADLKELSERLGNVTPKLDILIGKDDSLAYAFISRDKEGKEVERVEYSDYKFDGAIDAKLFSYTAPKDAQVTDVTDRVLEQLPRKAAEKKEK